MGCVLNQCVISPVTDTLFLVIETYQSKGKVTNPSKSELSFPQRELILSIFFMFNGEMYMFLLDSFTQTFCLFLTIFF